MGFWKRRDVEIVPPDEHFTLAPVPLVPRPVARHAHASRPEPEEPVVEFELLPDAPHPFDLVERAAPPAAPAPPATNPFRTGPLPPGLLPGGIRSEWARRAVGPTPAHRVRGACGRCRTPLSVSRAPRPLRVCCPECGRARVLT